MWRAIRKIREKPNKVNSRQVQNKISWRLCHTNCQFTHSKKIPQQRNLNSGSKIHDVRYQKLLPQYTIGAIWIHPAETQQFSRRFHQIIWAQQKSKKYGWVYAKMEKGVYLFPQSVLLSKQLREDQLSNHVYVQIKTTPGFCKHIWRPICFTLVVDYFGVKYQGKEHTDHIISVLKNKIWDSGRLGR